MSEKIEIEKIKSLKTSIPNQNTAQGYYRWSITYNDGKSIDKYNSDGTKNLYVETDTMGKSKVLLPLTNAKSISLLDSKGKLATKVDVPDKAVVFQRRIGFHGGGGVNYNNNFRTVEIEIPEIMTALVNSKTRVGEQDWVECEYDLATDKYVTPSGTQQLKLWPARTIQKQVPEVTYREYWIIGWRRREADNSIIVGFDAVYPDGKVDHHHSFAEKPWFLEPQWKPEEQV